MHICCLKSFFACVSLFTFCTFRRKRSAEGCCHGNRLKDSLGDHEWGRPDSSVYCARCYITWFYTAVYHIEISLRCTIVNVRSIHYCIQASWRLVIVPKCVIDQLLFCQCFFFFLAVEEQHNSELITNPHCIHADLLPKLLVSYHCCMRWHCLLDIALLNHETEGKANNHTTILTVDHITQNFYRDEPSDWVSFCFYSLNDEASMSDAKKADKVLQSQSSSCERSI